MKRTPKSVGQRLRSLRMLRGLGLRDVEAKSGAIARRLGSRDYRIGISRLSDIENEKAVPSIYRIYSLAEIYDVSVLRLLRWYGIPV